VKNIVKKGLNALGVIAPAVCLVHCLATPIILTALPLISASGPHRHEDNDATFHWIIVAICALAILPAFKSHGKVRVLGLFAAGAAFVLVPAYVHIEGLFPHIAVAIAGSTCLVSANLLNRKYSKAPACCDVPHVHPS